MIDQLVKGIANAIQNNPDAFEKAAHVIFHGFKNLSESKKSSK